MDTLRQRLSAARTWFGPLQRHPDTRLNYDTMLRYREKLRPLFAADFFERLERRGGASEQERRRTRFVLEHALSVPLATVANLHVQPGDAHYAVWLFVSAYFPVIAACLAPVGNLVSFVALLNHWQADADTGRAVADGEPTHALNIAGFVLGLVANGALVMNFSGQARYMLAQCVLVSSFLAAAGCLLAAVVVAAVRLGRGPLVASEGLWLAVFTIGIYALCAGVLCVNAAGSWRNKYRARFNLESRQRRLMAHTIAFSVWQAVGTVVMAQLIAGLSYGSSLYYCTVSMLTIGLGDIVPVSAGAKVFALLFSLVGVLIMGLIVAVLRQVILYAATPSLFWHRVEKQRRSLVLDSDTLPAAATAAAADAATRTTPEAFAMMRAIRARVSARQKRTGLIATVAVFVLFWLLGALVFYACEPWSYFNAVYFCFLCLLTIGYGDFHPESPLGRVFFVVWAIAAVPLMTILISNLGDTLFGISDKLDLVGSKVLDLETYRRLFRWKHHPLAAARARASPVEDPARSAESNTTTMDQTVEPGLAQDQESGSLAEQISLTLEISNLLKLLRQIMADKLETPGKEYEFEEWAKHMRHLGHTDAEDSDFWIGELSPLRLPLHESNYLLFKLLVKIDKDVRSLMKAQSRALGTEDSDKMTDSMSFSRGEALQLDLF